MDSQTYKDILKRGELCKEVKKQILSDSFSTDVEIRNYILKLCKIHNYEQSFPTLVMTNFTVANQVPENDSPIDLYNKAIYTVDFGFNSKFGYPLDNSCCFIRDPKLQVYLDSYKENISKVMKILEEKYKEKGSLYVLDIQDLIQKSFNESNYSFYLIPDCDAHTINKQYLHQKTIPMCNKTKTQLLYDSGLTEDDLYLKEDTLFTIEPHILIPNFEIKEHKDDNSSDENSEDMPILDPIHIWEEPTPIMAVLIDKAKNIVKYYKIGEVPEKYILAPSMQVTKTKANRISFFVEDTYLLAKNKKEIIKIT